jgi:16S rRNA (cytidine1402-2'-O)-methyltransferase
MGKLYIVATPIGNMDDITLRALKLLEETNVIFAEDTRSTLNLLRHHNIETNNKEIISFFEGNEENRVKDVFLKLQHGNVALVSESGTPLISDPGFKMIRELASLDIKIESIPGPTALITALTLSGLPTNSFVFLGFLPKKEGKAKTLLADTKRALEVLEQCKSLILYESPHRLLATLKLIEEVFGDIDLSIGRELTKIYEEVRREKISESIKHFTVTDPRGEFVIVFSTNTTNQTIVNSEV